MSGTKNKFLLFLFLQLAFLFPEGTSNDESCCSLDKRFGEYCPTTCGISIFFQNYQSHVDKELTNIENDLKGIHNMSITTNHNIDNIIQMNTVMLKESPDNYIEKVKEIESEILRFETISGNHEYEIQKLEYIVSSNNKNIKNLKKLIQQLHSRCRESCQDTVQISEITGQDCQSNADKGERKSGLYYIQPLRVHQKFLVYCEIDSAGRGWTVLQRRLDGSVDFAQNWIPYKEGFGYLSPDDSTEFWLGNEKIHLITTQTHDPYLLEITLKDWSNEKSSWKAAIKMESVQKEFKRTGGGVYTADQTANGYDDGIIWAIWLNNWYSLKETTMKIIPYKKFAKLRSETSQVTRDLSMATVLDQVSTKEKSEHRKLIESSAAWCHVTNISLNVNKMKEMIIAFKRGGRVHTPVHIDGFEDERVDHSKISGINLCNDLTLDKHSDTIIKNPTNAFTFLEYEGSSAHTIVLQQSLQVHHQKSTCRMHHMW
ncbi:fibrinogen gamma chain-like [Narcine bancroftii]|uniref:fibrinogen gamma chain-like n=1 Tax=Narcine bancroftii TaxID=1343680 RepID=UPI0038315F7B